MSHWVHINNCSIFIAMLAFMLKLICHFYFILIWFLSCQEIRLQPLLQYIFVCFLSLSFWISWLYVCFCMQHRADFGGKWSMSFYFFYPKHLQINTLQVSKSHSVVSDSLPLHGLDSPQNSPSQNIGVGSLSLLQGTFPTQGSNPGIPHCRQIL